MTKSELKGLIMECIDEIQLESVDEDQAYIEQCQIIEEACFALLEAEEWKPVFNNEYDELAKLKNNGKAYKEMAEKLNPGKEKEEAAKQVKKKLKLGEGFKVVGNKIVSVYTGKDGKGKQAAAIAATATAIAGTIAAIAISINKKKKKKEEEEN